MKKLTVYNLHKMYYCILSKYGAPLRQIFKFWPDEHNKTLTCNLQYKICLHFEIVSLCSQLEPKAWFFNYKHYNIWKILGFFAKMKVDFENFLNIFLWICCFKCRFGEPKFDKRKMVTKHHRTRLYPETKRNLG